MQNVIYNREKQRKNDMDNVIEVKRTMGKKAKLLILLAGIIVVALITSAFIRYSYVRTFEDFDVVSSVKTSGDNSADYKTFGANVIKVTKDGASYINEDGDTKWDVSYAMKMPQVEVCGDYAIVTDMNGKDVYVFNTEGQVSHNSLNYDIAGADVAEQGVYCLMLQGEDDNHIVLYDKDGKTILEYNVYVENRGYPIDIDLSNDGEKLVVSFLQMTGTETNTVIAMYNYSSIGQNENADRLVGSYTIDDSVYPVVKFVDNDTIVCFGDKDIREYRMTEKPEEKKVIELGDREIQGVFYNSKIMGYICLSDDEKASKYKIYIYDIAGNLKSTADFDSTYENIYAADDEIIVVGDMDCSIYRLNGSTKFRYSFAKSVMNITPDSKNNEYIVIFENETQTITLK